MICDLTEPESAQHSKLLSEYGFPFINVSVKLTLHNFVRTSLHSDSDRLHTFGMRLEMYELRFAMFFKIRDRISDISNLRSFSLLRHLHGTSAAGNRLNVSRPLFIGDYTFGQPQKFLLVNAGISKYQR